ncbi:uncharacterized protein LOC142564716 [Dermacentor variabilis]|uniref:uncharacterized protein LOC142564716 n=1 Tax=Dermacentor variabilis TaxID=34621 RepID=UPI003F5C444E
MSLCSGDDAGRILVEYPVARGPRGPWRRLRHQPGPPDAVDLKPARLVARAPAGLSGYEPVFGRRGGAHPGGVSSSQGSSGAVAPAPTSTGPPGRRGPQAGATRR